MAGREGPAVIAALTAALADRYRIERELGRGGMATVYLAHDLKHDRPVAIKVLHEDLGATLGPERFLAEIKTTAKLQHPHILALLDSGAAGGLLYYVMPFVDGETLRARLARDTQLPIDDAVRLASEIADALGYAHGHGIVHRDIKPENILLQGGHALVADFGIALAVQQAGGARMTQTGLSLGTPQYMSPEQAMGEKAIGPAADLYALGAVTYEMLTGEPPFTGATVQAIVAKVVSSEPEPPTRTRRTVPAHVEAAVLKALAKLPADRWTNAAAFQTALVTPGGTETLSRATRHASRSSGGLGVWRPIAIAGLLSTAVLAIVLVQRRAHDPEDRVRRLSIVLPDSAPLALVGESPLRIGRTSLALAPDGRTLVYVGWYRGRTHLFVRPLDDDRVRRLDGTEGAYAPFFSPDGQWLAFFSEHTLRKVSLAGGTPVELASAPEAYGGAWLANGRILFAKDEGGNPSVVGETGGAVQRAAFASIAGPSPLPDRRHVVGGDGRVLVGSVDDSAMQALAIDRFEPASTAGARITASTSPQFLRGGFLLTTFAGRLHALPFSDRSLATTGPQVALDEQVREEAMGFAAQFAVADDGTLAYVPGSAIGESVVVVADRSGRVDTLPMGRGFYVNPAFSPDGRRVAVTMLRGRQLELLVHDLLDDGTLVVARSPTWLYDPHFERGGEHLFLSGPSWVKGQQAAYTVRATGGALTERTDIGGSVMGVSRDGSWMAVAVDGRMVPLLRHDGKPAGELPSAGGWVEFSPDNRYVSWSAVGSKGYEILVTRLPLGGPVFNVTPEGCLEAKWMPGGDEIVCFKSDGLLYAVPLRIDDREVRGGVPRRLTREPLLETSGHTWALSPDGTRMLYFAAVPGDSARVVNVVTNFHELVRRKVAASVP